MDVRLSRSALLRGVAGGAVATYLSFRGGASDVVAQESADERAIEALENDDTEGAVEVWEAEFKEKPFDDDVRQALQASLVVHAMRCLDKGKLADAKAAVTRAKEVIPSSPAYRYLDEALKNYVKMLYSEDMVTGSFIEGSESDIETRYVEIEGMLGYQTEVLAVTAKNPGYFRGYEIGQIDAFETDAFAFRMLVYPMSDSGYVVVTFGRKTDDDYFAFTVDCQSSGYNTWNLAEISGGDWQEALASGSDGFAAKEWHALEVRVRGQAVEVWLDYQLVADDAAVDLEEGTIGFATGLNEGESGRTFTAAFDDLVVYSLK